MNVQPATVRRRRCQISLRTLLTLVTIGAGGFGWLGYHVRQANEQKAVIDATRRLGGSVRYEHEPENGPPRYGEAPPGPKWLRNLIGDHYFATVIELHVPDGNRQFVTFSDEPTSTDNWVRYLRHFTKLQKLTLRSVNCTDVDLSFLQHLTELESLALDHTGISNEGLTYIRELRKLRDLSLSGTRITDAGLISLEGFDQLEQLDLVGTQVTDEGLKHLHKLSALQGLRLFATDVTAEGCQALAKAAPRLRIFR